MSSLIDSVAAAGVSWEGLDELKEIFVEIQWLGGLEQKWGGGGWLRGEEQRATDREGN